ncbi:hypothetical protein SAMN04488587_1532 [Methanococcoides vulcani]|uniref:Uncharacterized protein n=1 Tax=Methanococcoides vulcani TaxID=1353158 RepID=A0A1I0AAZ6_9EURY|nr:hypothetical protein [Methanococcoides vulcani]SES91203.1 hypothetical protein SAMN04488587_1532 [Methanococcoides vulcani]
MSALASCLFAYDSKSDVLIGTSRFQFNESFNKSTDVYFSLMYKKLVNGLQSSSLYFYHDVLWCKGIIDEDTNEITEFEVSKRPKYGTRKYKNEYDSNVSNNLSNGNFQTMPKIVSIPITDISPASVISEKTIKFEKDNYQLNNFNPKLIIYESINERKYNFENLIRLINRSCEMDTKLVLHFSWPYLKGLASFLDKIKDNNEINIIHLGKQFCLESRNRFEKPPSSIVNLSLEGDLWDLYYPENTSLLYSIILPPLNTSSNYISKDDIIQWDWPLDVQLKNIRDHLNTEKIEKKERNLISFPPMLNSFLLPSEIKTSCIKNGSWMTLPIDQIFSTTMKEKNHSVSTFCGLCSELNNSRDIGYEFRNLFSTSAISKRTLFQSYIVETLNKGLEINNPKTDVNDSNKSILVANLYPYLATQSSFIDSILYLVKSMKNLLNAQNIPKLMYKNSELYLIFGDKSKVLIYQQGLFQRSSTKKLKKMFASSSIIRLETYYENNEFKVIISTKNSVRYLRYNEDVKRACRDTFDSFVLYNLTVQKNGSFYEKTVLNIDFDQKFNKFQNSLKLNVELQYRDRDARSKSLHELDILYCKLSKMLTLPIGLIQNTELLIPGPLPFHTVSDNDILISQGYDSLLLPFKKVTFFGYPGANFKQLLYQISLYDALLSEKRTIISDKDLSFSVNNTSESKRFQLPSTQNSFVDNANEINDDSPIDTLIRDEILSSFGNNDLEKDEIRTIQDLWTELKWKSNTEGIQNSVESHACKEQIEFLVKYDTDETGTISFPINTLIRKKVSDDYILLPVDELVEGDLIFYIQGVERESIENYLLKTLMSEDEMALEAILEPLVNLKTFYDVLNSLDYRKKYDETKMKRLYWLSLQQKENLFNLVGFLLDKKCLSEEEFNNLFFNSIWNEIGPEKVLDIFSEGNNKITKKKLYSLAMELGLVSYKEASFKVLCSARINEQKHYSFHNVNNLLVIGKLIGNSDVIENYQFINKKGSLIGRFLRMFGFSLRRVASGNSRLSDPIDDAISEKLKKCLIIKRNS